MAEAAKKRIQVQVNSELARRGNAILNKLGLSPTTAITMFYKRLVAEDALPFSTELTKREKAELDIKDITSKWPVTDLDNPDNLVKWEQKDD